MDTMKPLSGVQQREVGRQLNIVRSGAAEIIPGDALEQKVAWSVVSGTPLKVKLGTDPNERAHIHSGDIVQVGKRKFAKIIIE